MAKLSNDALLDAFKEMTLLELSEFVKQFEDAFDVKAAAPVAVAGPAAAGAGAGAGAREQGGREQGQGCPRGRRGHGHGQVSKSVRVCPPREPVAGRHA